MRYETYKMPVSAHDITKKLHTNLPGADVQIIDLAGDGNHYKVVVTCPDFAGKTRVAQHQMVYAALGDMMKETLHALAIETKV